MSALDQAIRELDEKAEKTKLSEIQSSSYKHAADMLRLMRPAFEEERVIEKPVMSETEFQKFIEKILAGTSWHRKSIFVTGKIEHIRRFLSGYVDIKEIDTEQNSRRKNQ